MIGQRGSRNGNLVAMIQSLKVRIQMPGVARNCARYLVSIVNQGRQALPTQASMLARLSSALLIRIIWTLLGISSVPEQSEPRALESRWGDPNVQPGFVGDR